MTKQDRVLGIILALISICIFFYVYFVDYNQFGEDPGPGLMSLVVGVGVFLCSLGLLFWPHEKNIEVADNKSQQDEGEEEILKPELLENYIQKTIIVSLAIVLYVVVLNLVGFVISSTLFMAFMIYYLDEVKTIKRTIISLFFSLAVTFTIFFVFEEYLNIFLP